MAADENGLDANRLQSLDHPPDDPMRDLPAGRDTRLHRILHSTRAALDAGDVARASRLLDAAWRRARDDVSVLEAYGRILLQRGDCATALARLEDAIKREASPTLAALALEARLGAEGQDSARTALQAALLDFAVLPGDPLHDAAGRIAIAQSDGLRGWVGLTPALELIGQVAGLGTDGQLEVRSGRGDVLLSHGLTASADGAVDFRLALPRATSPTILSITVNGEVPLLGSGLAYPPAYRLDGRANIEGGAIAGWVKLGWAPSVGLHVVAEDGHGHRVQVPTFTSLAPRQAREFTIDREEVEKFRGPISVSALLPSDSLEPFPDGPLNLDAVETQPEAVRARRRRKTRGAQTETPAEQQRGVDIIVPVYLGRDETVACIEALFKTVDAGTDIIVVDDASPDPELVAALEVWARKGAITLLRNERNLGFPGAVNRGFRHRKQRDVVILNSDTVVHGNWLERLRAAAYGAPDIGTVTPLTDDDSIARYAGHGASSEDARTAALIDSVAAEVNAGAVVDLPVGVGFCLYIRRACLAEVGDFDAVTFGKGYGEENDFCMRASARGWRHVLAPNVFVRHAGGRSFGSRRQALMERNGRLLNARYPEYPALVQRFIAANPVAPFRRRLDEAMLKTGAGQYVVLVSLALTGGVDRFVRERCATLRREGFTPILVQPTEEGPGSCVLTTRDGVPNDLRYRIPEEIADIESLFRTLTIDHVEIHHFLDSDQRLIDAVIGLGHPVDVYVHDYGWICPRLTMLGGRGRYCGEPELPSCEACIRIYGSNRTATPSVAFLRERSQRWLSQARDVIVPCQDVAERMKRYFPTLSPRIESWETELVRGVAEHPGPGPIRIAVIGGIGVQKGYQVVLDCARDAAERDLPIEFVVFGHTEDDEALFETGRAFVTGQYDDGEIRDLLRREKPHLAFFPSVTPETWCYTLSHALAVGLPIAAFDLGSIAERLKAARYGRLMASTADSSEVNDELMRIASEAWSEGQRPEANHVAADVAATERESSQAESRADDRGGVGRGAGMTDQREPSVEVSSQDGLMASVRLIALPKGLYLFSVRAASPSQVAAAQNLTLPAVHVGLGPNAAAGQIEFLPGPNTRGTWLCERGSTLVANITAPTVTLVLTSVRAPNGDVLSIELDRLDRQEDTPIRAEALPAPMPRNDIVQEVRAAQEPPAMTVVKSDQPVADDPSRVRVEVVTHLRGRGDVAFVDVDWAGRLGGGTWLEAFAVKPVENVAGLEIEYKGLTSRGIETPWVSGGNPCGTRGLSIPLLGFAMRVKATGSGPQYDCEYSGYFQSGAVVGPMRNGVPCRSTVPNDPLEGIQLRIAVSSAAGDGVAAVAPHLAEASVERASNTARPGPQFSKLREAAAAGGATAAASARQAAKTTKANLGQFLKTRGPRGAERGESGKAPMPLALKARGAARATSRPLPEGDPLSADERQT
ncbi:MAG: glycosyltransferase [Alphaproteobacteria bacterium]